MSTGWTPGVLRMASTRPNFAQPLRIFRPARFIQGVWATGKRTIGTSNTWGMRRGRKVIADGYGIGGATLLAVLQPVPIKARFMR
jgi:hypothetical protein